MFVCMCVRWFYKKEKCIDIYVHIFYKYILEYLILMYFLLKLFILLKLFHLSTQSSKYTMLTLCFAYFKILQQSRGLLHRVHDNGVFRVIAYPEVHHFRNHVISVINVCQFQVISVQNSNILQMEAYCVDEFQMKGTQKSTAIAI